MRKVNILFWLSILGSAITLLLIRYFYQEEMISKSLAIMLQTLQFCGFGYFVFIYPQKWKKAHVSDKQQKQ